MAKSKIVEVTEKITDKVEDAFVESFLSKEGESVKEAKKRFKK